MNSLAHFRAKARRDNLEIEHILAAAKNKIPGLAEELEELIVECGWTDGGLTDQNDFIIPFRRWAVTACAYLRGGCYGLCVLAGDRKFLPFVFAMLRELHSWEAVDAVLAISHEIIKMPRKDMKLAKHVAETLNSLFSFEPLIYISARDALLLREFLHQYICLPVFDVERAIGTLALRGIGNEESIRLIQEQPLLAEPWHETNLLTIRTIQKRLKNLPS